MSQPTLIFLQRQIRDEWRFAWSKEPVGEIEPEWTGSLMRSHLLGKDIYAAYEEEVDESLLRPELIAAIEQIGEHISKREKDGQTFWDLQLHGYVTQFWLKNGSCPTVAEVSKMMRIARSEFYRRGLTSEQLRDAYAVASGVDCLADSSKLKGRAQ